MSDARSGPRTTGDLLATLCSMMAAGTLFLAAIVAMNPPDQGPETVAASRRREDSERADQRATILSNMPLECRAAVTAALPERHPPTQAAMEEVVTRLCPQAWDDD